MRIGVKQLACAALAIAIVLPFGGCFQDNVSAVKAGHEFQCEEALMSVRKAIILWQANPKHADEKLPETLAEIETVQKEIATAQDGFWMGYFFRFCCKGDGVHWVLFAYPQKKGLAGERAYYIDDGGSSHSREYPETYDHSAWDYDSLIKEFSN